MRSQGVRRECEYRAGPVASVCSHESRVRTSCTPCARVVRLRAGLVRSCALTHISSKSSKFRRKHIEILMISTKYWLVHASAPTRRVSAQRERRAYGKCEHTTHVNTQKPQGPPCNHMACDLTATSKMPQKMLWSKKIL